MQGTRERTARGTRPEQRAPPLRRSRRPLRVWASWVGFEDRGSVRFGTDAHLQSPDADCDAVHRARRGLVLLDQLHRPVPEPGRAGRYATREDAENALRALLQKREGGGLLSLAARMNRKGQVAGSAIGPSARRRRVPAYGSLAHTPNATRRKELGAFYTPPAMAAKLVEWAVRVTRRTVCWTPASADSCSCVLRASGCLPWAQPVRRSVALAVRVRPRTRRTCCGHTIAASRPEADSPAATSSPRPRRAFRCPSGRRQPALHSLPGLQRSAERRARSLAAAAGIRLTRLASSWAPFVFHGAAFVAPGGRMASGAAGRAPARAVRGRGLGFLQRSFGQSRSPSSSSVCFQAPWRKSCCSSRTVAVEGQGRGPAGRLRDR